MPPPPPPQPLEGVAVGVDVLDESASMKAKRIALQRKGAAAMIAAEEYARRFESGDVVVVRVLFGFYPVCVMEL